LFDSLASLMLSDARRAAFIRPRCRHAAARAAAAEF